MHWIFFLCILVRHFEIYTYLQATIIKQDYQRFKRETQDCMYISADYFLMCMYVCVCVCVTLKKRVSEVVLWFLKFLSNSVPIGSIQLMLERYLYIVLPVY